MSFPKLILKPGREKSLLKRHPWVFSGAVQRPPSAAPGSIIDVTSASGQFLARAYYNVLSKIPARVLSFDADTVIDQDFITGRVAAAYALRKDQLADPSRQTAARIIMSEADRLPGLIVDKYGEFLVVQALTAGMDQLLPNVCEALIKVVAPRGIYERSDDAVRTLEGLPLRSGLLHGEEPSEGGVEILENGLRYRIDLRQGHKTGFYLDQRQNHALIGTLAAGREVLDCFCYTGGFSLSAAAGGAKTVLSVDASGPALERLTQNLAANGLERKADCTQQEGNAFEVLRELKDAGRLFDMIILDPPKFAAHGAQVDKAARGYKDLSLLAFKMLRPGGYLATFSCSGHISADLFQKIIFGAASDAGADAHIVRHLFQADDHPVLLSIPESLYLKGLLLRVV